MTEKALTKQARALILGLIQKDIMILRQVMYKELQEWKRTIYKNSNPESLGVEGEVWKAMELTASDKKFIDEQLEWFLLSRDISDSLIAAYGKNVMESLKNQKNPSLPQKNLKTNLEEALLGDKLKTPSSLKEPDKNEDIPF